MTGPARHARPSAVAGRGRGRPCGRPPRPPARGCAGPGMRAVPSAPAIRPPARAGLGGSRRNGPRALPAAQGIGVPRRPGQPWPAGSGPARFMSHLAPCRARAPPWCAPRGRRGRGAWGAAAWRGARPAGGGVSGALLEVGLLDQGSAWHGGRQAQWIRSYAGAIRGQSGRPGSAEPALPARRRPLCVGHGESAGPRRAAGRCEDGRSRGAGGGRRSIRGDTDAGLFSHASSCVTSQVHWRAMASMAAAPHKNRRRSERVVGISERWQGSLALANLSRE